ncbi:MAG TPA: phosphoribosylanthranilate isomerase [Alphaproteobacteria bacterium]|nr:phosphoribosylanthranilate isomerase [Alphaproteobacteria bacterium]
MAVVVKICGINDLVAMRTAVEAGARYVGLVFYPRSPRAVNPNVAAKLATLVPPSVTLTGLFVDPTDADLKDVLEKVPLRMIQLHGDETPERVAEVKQLTGLKVMKAIPVLEAKDLDNIAAFEDVADMLLFDAKPPNHVDAMPGGNAQVFDWGLLHGKAFSKPWMLAGGLNADNLVEAVRITGAHIVDVSSGVEDAPGRKSPIKIREFIDLASNL